MRGAWIAVWILLGLGVLLLGVASVGFMMGKPAGLDGTFLGVGAVLVIAAVFVAVFHERMEKVTIKLPGGGEFSTTMAKVKSKVQKGESEIKAKNLIMLSEAKEEHR